MTPTAIIIFMGIPAAGLLAGLVVAVGTLLRWNRPDAPESHYIASRHSLVPADAAEAEWMDELDALKIPYRHTVC